MKLQNFTVLFVIIVLPIIIVTSYYMSLQADTINMQTSYNTKLLESTKEAIEAFEINTVEWNSSYSATAESKRRDIMASINTFTTSFANNLGIAGSNSEAILSYIPAIAYTLYDGYYIYSPTETKITAIDENGVTRYDEDGKIIYMTSGGSETTDPAKADTDYKHILKPFSAYSKQYKNGNTNVVINYTLDNYIRVYGTIGDEYVYKYGYLIDTNTDKINFKSLTISDLKLNGSFITPEVLSEQIAYDNTTGIFNYFYSTDNTKVYIDVEDVDNTNFFILDHDGTKVSINELTQNTYKKCTIPKKVGENWSYIEIYYCLNDRKWYRKEKETLEFSESNSYEIPNAGQYLNDDTNDYTKIEYDYSAVNYYVESYVFSLWVQNNLSDIKGINNSEIFNGGNPEASDSVFNQERRNVIKETLTSDLYQAITSYSRNSEGEYQLPNISETDWDQILSNVSILTFAQNIPIGMKYYNNYAIATSTFNKEYVDPNEIYLNADEDEYYHKPYCSKIKNNNIIGYRNIDYVVKSYEDGSTTKYYYLHGSDGQSLESCYYCLIQKDLYVKASGGLLTEEKKAYNTALARERYVAKTTRLPDEVESTYYLYTEPVISETDTIASGGKYIITTPPGNEDEKTGAVTTPLTDFGEYKIEPTGITSDQLEEVVEEGGGLGSYDSPIGTTADTEDTEDVPDYSSYIADFERIIVTVTGKNVNGLYFDIDSISSWGTGTLKESFTNMGTFLSSDLGNGYINIRLPYKKTYEEVREGSAEVELTANINQNNNLTLVTKIKGMKADSYVRLEFTNNGKTYYSNNIFKINNETEETIYCRIEEDTSWYTNEWNVNVKSIDLAETIASGTVKYYTIRDYVGLEGFSQAVNEGAKTSERTFQLLENIDYNNGTIAPIAGIQRDDNNDGINDIWFDGIFNGDGKTIKNIKINNDENIYNCFGLFGWVGNKGKIKELNIENLKIRLIKLETLTGYNKNYKAGGLAGYCDEKTEVTDINVKKSTIVGKAYSGGIVGYSKASIKSSKVESTNVLTCGNYILCNSGNENNSNNLYVGGIAGYITKEIENCEVINNDDVVYTIGADREKFNWKVYSNQENELSETDYLKVQAIAYFGGIAGYTENDIVECKVEKYKIGNADKYNLNFNIDSVMQVKISLMNNENYYCVGGLAGYTSSSTIENNSISGSEITGGKIEFKATDKITLLYSNNIIYGTGGIVGYNNGGSILGFNNNSKIEGAMNVGGIVGYNNSGTIDYCFNTGKVYGKNNKINWTNTDSEGNLVLSANTGTGGIAGFNHDGTIKNCRNEGDIETNLQGGGIVGVSYGSERNNDGTPKATISMCVNKGTVHSESEASVLIIGNRVGGIAGTTSRCNIEYCYNAGEIKVNKTGSTVGVSNAGGIVAVVYGSIKGDNIFKYCYNIGTVAEACSIYPR